MHTYRIAEVAERTGFSTPTLRYYEEIGLVPQAERTAAGYRVYDDRAIERLRFVARAKGLGCTLEEIADLAEVWDLEECGPVKHRLRGLVAAKLDETETRLAELLALQADLRATAAMLETAPLDGPCDETCGCGDTASVAKAKHLLPLYDESAAVACTLGDDEIADRIAMIERLRAATTAIERTETGLLLQFPRDEAVAADVRRFALDEKRCCAFWGFAVVDGDDELVLRWDGPPTATPLLDRLDALLRSDESFESIRELL